MSSVRASRSAIEVAPYAQAALILLPLMAYAALSTRSAAAQVIPTEGGTQSIVDATNSQIDITGGRESEDGANLFHSFEQFDLSTNQRANFITETNTQNIFGRVESTQASIVNGTLQVSGSDANLYLMNPAGILLGPDARLNLTGGFSATTATGLEFGETFNLGNSGNYSASYYSELTGNPSAFRFEGEQAGAVVNLGDLSVGEGESIGLIGGTVVNTGKLSAPQGTVTVAAVEGESVVRLRQGNRLLSFEIEAIDESLGTHRTITPTSIGEMLTGSALDSGVSLVTNADGTAQIVGSEEAISEAGGVAIATGTLSATGEQGGNINVLGETVSLLGTTLEASGTYGGGLIRVGGNYKGEGDLINATQTLVDNDTKLTADAVEAGDGGRVIIWSDDTTQYGGYLSARGGFAEGDGGFAEISGKVGLSVTGSVDLSAPAGQVGTALFDPRNITITDAAPTPSEIGDNLYLSSRAVEALADSADVVLEADNDIVIEAIADGALTFKGNRSVTFRADANARDGGEFRMENLSDAIEVESGNITISGAGVTAGKLIIDTHYDEDEPNDPSIGRVMLESSEWLEVTEITSERGDVSLSATDMSIGLINTSSNDHNKSGQTADDRSQVAAGNVSLSATGDITVGEILTYGNLSHQNHHAPDGGDVSIVTSGGSIEIARTIQTYSHVNGHGAGAAGDISLAAQGNISVNTDSVGDTALNATSTASSFDSGDGGHVSLTATEGQIDVVGNIETSAETGNGDGDSSDSAAGNAGSVTLLADGDITADRILSRAIADADSPNQDAGNAGAGGDIVISSANGNVKLGQVESYSSADSSYALGGGSVEITAHSIDVQGIDTSTRADSHAQDSGDISIYARDSVVVYGEIESYSYARSGPIAGAGGNVSIIGNKITTGPIEAWSSASDGVSRQGGDITITQHSEAEGNFAFIDGDIRTYSFAGTEYNSPSNLDEFDDDDDEFDDDDEAYDNAFDRRENAGQGGDVLIDMGQNVESDFGTSVVITGDEAREASINTSSIANSGGASSAGNVYIYADVVDVGAVNTQAAGTSDSMSAGSVTLRGNRTLTVENIAATSTDSVDGIISLTGNDIAITGDRVVGSLVHLMPSTLSRDIAIGFESDVSDALNISTEEIDSIDSLISIGDTASSGRVSLSESIVSIMTGFRPTIHILGGDRLVGPNSQNAETLYNLGSEGSGSIAETNITFSEIEEIQGGAGDDTFRLERGVSVEDFKSVVGGGGNNTLSYENFTDEPLTVDLSKIAIDNLKLIGPATESTLQGSSETNLWRINGEGRGSVNDSIEFENFENIVGGNGIDTLDYGEYESAVTVSLEGKSTGLTSFSSIENVIGSEANSDVLLGTHRDDTFRLGSASQLNSVEFKDFEIFNGGDGANTFIVEPDGLDTLLNTRIIGGSDLDNSQSNNRIVVAANTSTWTVQGKNKGTLEQGGNLIEFEEIQHIENNGENNSASEGEMSVLFAQPAAQITGSISSGNSNLTLIGDDINIGHGSGSGDNQNGTISGNGKLSIRPATEGIAIELGGSDGYSAQSLNITEGELAALQQGFTEIVIGSDTTSSLSLNNNVSFQDSVSLIAQGNLDMTQGKIAVTAGESLSLVAGGSLFGSNVSTSGADVSISAQESVRLADIETVGEEGSGNVDITAANGTITTGSIITSEASNSSDAGNVNLSSAGSIEVEFIEAEGQRSAQDTDERVAITTSGTFTATDANSRGSSISTVGAGEERGSILITFGNGNADAERFTIGILQQTSTEQSSTAGALASDQVAIRSGDFEGSYRESNITLTNRGLISPELSLPPTEKPNAERSGTERPSEEIAVIEERSQAIEPASESHRLDLSASVTPSSTSTVVPSAARSEDDILFEVIETNAGQAFAQYFGLDETDEQTAVATLTQVQTKLDEVQQTSDVTPALVYVYFVPDAESETATRPEAHKSSHDDQLEVMLITADRPPTRHRRWGVTRAQVDEITRKLRQETTSQFSTERQYLPPAQQLYDWIVSPISAELEDQQIQSLGFVMDTGLRTMPIAALHDGDRYLIENYSLGILPTFSLTDFQNQQSSVSDFRNGDVLAMGASEFEDQPDLPAVDEEVSLITRQLWKGDAFLNEDFVLENLQTQLAGNDYGIVHLATHATFKSDDLDGSYIQLWDQKLSLNEVSELGLSDAEIGLIILSACNTALGDRNSEYGFAGFAISAGSPSALASLWPVNDEGTLGFMSQFYSELRPSPIRAEALRKAQMTLLNGEVGIDYGDVYGPEGEIIVTIPELTESGQWDFSHPFYWSAFTMIGNPW